MYGIRHIIGKISNRLTGGCYFWSYYCAKQDSRNGLLHPGPVVPTILRPGNLGMKREVMPMRKLLEEIRVAAKTACEPRSKA